jgi:hypothetical protein
MRPPLAVQDAGMDLQLNDDEIEDLTDVLDAVITDLSPEIANTDNANYRAMLRARRTRLQAIRSKLDRHAGPPA